MVSCGVATVLCAAAVAAAVAVAVTAASTVAPGMTTTLAPAFVANVTEGPPLEDFDRRARETSTRRGSSSRTGGGATSSSRKLAQHERPMTLDPRKTWQAFLRHSERTETRRPKKRVNPSFLRMQGPQGPPGPRGPRGPPGANITREEMFREFKGLLREAAERRAQLMAEMQCSNTTNCSTPLASAPGSEGGQAGDLRLPWLPPLVEIDRTSLLPRSQSAFFWELSQEMRARKAKELRIHPFHRPFAEGSFERGSGLNATRGLFRSPMNGLYLFFATAFVSRPTSPRALRKQLGPGTNEVSLIVCMNARCQKNLSLRTTSEFGDGEHTMSLSVSGPLMLRAGQVVSLWFHNRTPYPITIHEGSQFSGFLVGL
ncbi:erythroferrone-like [Haemaphysalis longicornis]